jgi:hypothetical protein
VIGYVFESKGSRASTSTPTRATRATPGRPIDGAAPEIATGFRRTTESYSFANKRLAWETIAPLLDRASPLRTAHLRDPVGPQILSSAAKQSRRFHGSTVEIASSPSVPRNDTLEAAAVIGADPVEFRS